MKKKIKIPYPQWLYHTIDKLSKLFLVFVQQTIYRHHQWPNHESESNYITLRLYQKNSIYIIKNRKFIIDRCVLPLNTLLNYLIVGYHVELLIFVVRLRGRVVLKNFLRTLLVSPKSVNFSLTPTFFIFIFLIQTNLSGIKRFYNKFYDILHKK